MGYDTALAARIADVIDVPVTERRMFGGLTFLVEGRMAVAVSGQGGIMVRVGHDESDALVETTGATRVVMRGREMRGWLRIESENLAGDRLASWVNRGVAAAVRAGSDAAAVNAG